MTNRWRSLVWHNIKKHLHRFLLLEVVGKDGFNGIAEVLEFLATLPTPEEIIALRPSKTLQT